MHCHSAKSGTLSENIGMGHWPPEFLALSTGFGVRYVHTIHPRVSVRCVYILIRESCLAIVTEGETLPIVPMFTGLSVNTWETAKIAHESHNDIRCFCWHAGAIFVLLAKLGLWKPPSGTPEGLGLLGESCTFPLPLWSSNCRELGETELVYSAH